MTVFLPFFYIILGYCLGFIWKNLDKYLSFILINVLIPSVVFLTIVTYNGTIIPIIILSYLFSLCMYGLGGFLFHHKKDAIILQVCFSYYNIGWLGLPIAIYFFGDSVIPLIIAAYIGGMLFGSTICIYSLNRLSIDQKISPLKKLITAPPFWGCILGLSFKSTIGTIELNDHYLLLYDTDKIVMGLFGMAILGMWLQKSPIKKEHWIESLIFSLYRLFIGLLVFSVLLYGAFLINLISYQELKYLLILPLLPVAANIVVLESYYLKSATSSHIISINTIFSLMILILFGIYSLYWD